MLDLAGVECSSDICARFTFCKIWSISSSCKNVDLPVGYKLNVYANLFVEEPLILNSKLGSYICDSLVDCCVAWGDKYDVIHVDNEDDFSSIENAVVHTGLLEYYLFYYLGEVLLPNPRYLPLPIEVLEELEDVHVPASALGFNTFGSLHIHVKFDVGLREDQD